MSRASIILVVILIVLVGGLLWLSRKPVSVTPHHIEKAVTLSGDADA